MLGAAEIVFVELVRVPDGAVIGAPCVECLSRPVERTPLLRRLDLDLQTGNDGVGYLLLHGEQFRYVAVEAFNPDLGAGRRVDQGDIHPHTSVSDGNGALGYVSHAQP